MQSPEQTVAYLARRIGCVYYHERPLMYGGTAEGVDQLLLTWHEVWAEITHNQDCFQAEWRARLAAEDCGSAIFSGRYASLHPAATQHETALYVVRQWRLISEALDLPLPHDELRKLFPVT